MVPHQEKGKQKVSAKGDETGSTPTAIQREDIWKSSTRRTRELFKQAQAGRCRETGKGGGSRDGVGIAAAR